MTRCLLLTLVLATPQLVAQHLPPQVGPTAALGIAVLKENDGNKIRIHNAGDSGSLVEHTAITPSVTGAVLGLGIEGLELDAFSVGLDSIAFTPPSPLQTRSDHLITFIHSATNAWVAGQFSTTPATVGEDSSNLRAISGMLGPDRGNAVYSTVVPPSTSVPTHITNNELWLDLAQPDFGSDAEGKQTIGLDSQLPLREDDPVLFTALGFKIESFYFSVTKACAEASPAVVPSAWWDSTLASGATILVTHYVQGAWSQPTVFLSYVELGLNVTDDIDALAVGEQKLAADADNVVYSLKGNASVDPDNPGLPYSQLLHTVRFVANSVTSYIPTAVRDNTLKELAKKMRFRKVLASIDDIDGACFPDPRSEIAALIRGPQNLGTSSPWDHSLDVSLSFANSNAEIEDGDAIPANMARVIFITSGPKTGQSFVKIWVSTNKDMIGKGEAYVGLWDDLPGKHQVALLVPKSYGNFWAYAEVRPVSNLLLVRKSHKVFGVAKR